MCVGGGKFMCGVRSLTCQINNVRVKQETALDPFLTCFTLYDESETSEFLIVFGRAVKDEESDDKGRNKRWRPENSKRL